MPGGGRLLIAWVWKEKPPLYWTALVVILWFCWIALIFDSFLLKYVTAPGSSTSHSHAVTVEGSVRYMNAAL